MKQSKIALVILFALAISLAGCENASNTASISTPQNSDVVFTPTVSISFDELFRSEAYQNASTAREAIRILGNMYVESNK